MGEGKDPIGNCGRWVAGGAASSGGRRQTVGTCSSSPLRRLSSPPFRHSDTRHGNRCRRRHHVARHRVRRTARTRTWSPHVVIRTARLQPPLPPPPPGRRSSRLSGGISGRSTSAGCRSRPFARQPPISRAGLTHACVACGEWWGGISLCSRLRRCPKPGRRGLRRGAGARGRVSPWASSPEPLAARTWDAARFHQGSAFAVSGLSPSFCLPVHLPAQGLPGSPVSACLSASSLCPLSVSPTVSRRDGMPAAAAGAHRASRPGRARRRAGR